MLTQSESGSIYAANNKGLVEFNGSQWTLYPSPNETIIRSVLADGSRVYSGHYMGFGFWNRNQYGNLEYSSLSDTLDIEMIEDEHFWNIIKVEEYVLFQSLDRIYIWDEASMNVNIIEANGVLTNVFDTSLGVFYHVLNEGLFKLENGQGVLVNNDIVFQENRIIGLLDMDNKFLALTERQGFYEISEEEIIPWGRQENQELSLKRWYSALQLANGGVILGSVSSGIYHLGPQGNIVYQLDRTGGLANNTALALFEDRDANIWVGLDNGIDCINIEAPFRNFIDQDGNLGTTYATLVSGNYLYLGTNQGLFYRMLDSKEPIKLIPGTSGQVWKLQQVGDDIFCGHDLGLFQVIEDQAVPITTLSGAWNVKEIPGREKELVLGTYNGLYRLTQVDQQWILANKMAGFDISSKYFEFVSPSQILLSHEYKGVYRLNLSEEYDQILNFERLTSVDKSANSCLVGFGNDVIYASRYGIFLYDKNSGDFIKDDDLSSIFADEQYISGSLVPDVNGNLWSFTKDYFITISSSQMDGGYTISKISAPQSLRNEMEGYENIALLSGTEYVVGTSTGYLIMDTAHVPKTVEAVNIHAINIKELDKEFAAVVIDSLGVFKSKFNNISFDFNTPNYQKFLKAQYQYRLDGWQDNWSPWSEESGATFENLPSGRYTFMVKSRINNQVSEDVASYEFIIQDHWFRSPMALTIYALLMIGILVGINLLYRRYYQLQRQRIVNRTQRELKLQELASQQQIMELTNEKLQNDIESRNRELAMSTMNMISKNNALNTIKNELFKIKSLEEITPVIQHIDNTISNEDDWKMFEEAFNYADTNFFKKLKDKHPDLTPNDLRLCVYLRLNLSSKEIAPLLNISPRSVEIKRYRLRKKLNLDSKVNLNEYFIDL
ncbi:helix-turn-helix and ligand-binding sensor domain-containing protein [Aureitalea marina]|nr:triple tyrosine motif-containing protein [Aureitalea marina]